MIQLPDSLAVARDKNAEAELVAQARAWVTKDERTPGIHASDILDPMLAYWQRKVPRPLSDRLVNTFLVGKVLHAFVIDAALADASPNAMGVSDGIPGALGATDIGSRSSSDLGIEYSPDVLLRGVIREIKTTRSFYPPKDLKDLGMYLEQLLVYMAAENHTHSQLWILYLNLKDKESGRTNPAFRCFNVTVSDADLRGVADHIRGVRERLEVALETNNPKTLGVCREFKCGRRNCDWYDDCKPAGRFGTSRWDG